MKSWSLRIGKFFGIDVFIHWTFWILVLWIFMMHASGGHGLVDGARGVLFVLALFGCVVLHEFGHALTARRFGVQTKDITLYPIGGIASLEGMPEKPGQELLVGLAGPAVNLFIALIVWVYLSVFGQIPDLAAISSSHDLSQVPFLWNLFFANLVLAVFNLLPAFPMDGGRALRSVLSFFIDRASATRVAAGIGQFLAIVFVFLGFFYNFWLVFIGLFVFLGAGGEAAQERMMTAISGLTVKDAIMRRFTVLTPNDTLDKVVDHLLNSQETEFVVADGGKPVGVLNRNAIIRGLSDQGRNAPVSAFMNSDFLVVNPDMNLQDLLQKVADRSREVVVVMHGDLLQGLIDRENIEEKIMIEEILKRRGAV